MKKRQSWEKLDASTEDFTILAHLDVFVVHETVNKGCALSVIYVSLAKQQALQRADRAADKLA